MESRPDTTEQLATLFEMIDGEEVVELTRALVRIPSVTGVEGLEIAEFIADWLRAAGIDAGLQHVGPNRANVWARLDGQGQGPRVLLNGHLDTKPVADMIIDPFEPRIENGRLYGRGACDMKAAVAGQMVTLKVLRQAGAPFRGTLLFGSEVGEEGGGWRFADLLDGGHCACDLAIVGEPTELELHIGNRGSFPLTVRTTGRATHTGMAYRGINAIQKMAAVITRIYELPCFQRTDPIWGRSPINAQQVRGGGKITSSVADECETIFDIRLNPDLEPAALQEAIEDALAEMRTADPSLHVEWHVRGMGPLAAVDIAPNHPLVHAVGAALADALGAPRPLGGFAGGCAASILLRRGIPAVIVGPGNLEQAHTVDEWIDVTQIPAAARVYVAAAFRLLNLERA